MGMTATEKILARRSGQERVRAGEVVVVDVDTAAIDDVQFDIFRGTFERLGGRVWNARRAILIADHYTPPSGIEEATIVRTLLDYGRTRGLRTIAAAGIKHQVFLEEGLIGPGQLLVATDSHTNTAGAVGSFAVALGPTDVAAVFVTGKTWLRVPPTIRFEIEGELRPGVTAMDLGLTLLGEHGRHRATYKAIEWAGSAIRALGLPGRMTLCNLSTEFGAKNGIVPTDDVTRRYAKDHGLEPFAAVSDADAEFEAVYPYRAEDFEPVVAEPPSPANVRPARSLQDLAIHQAYLGSCTHGSIEDLRAAARVLRGHRVKEGVALLVTPATRRVYQAAMREGLFDIFIDAGGTICSPGCGSCPGMHEGTLAEGEVRISTQNRNFAGRSGHPKSRIILASPETVAASAIVGKVACAEDVSHGAEK